jgi:hypothetical protein
MGNIIRPSPEPSFHADKFEAVDPSETRTDIAVLVSTLFLQRFTLQVGNTFLHLDMVAIGLVLLHQFFRGRLAIQYDRFLWFLALGSAASFSMLLNFNKNMLTGFTLFVVFYFLFAFTRSSTSFQYKRTLHAFQFLVALLSCIGTLQFAAQFVLDGRQLVNFYGLVPDFLFNDPAVGTHDARMAYNGLIEATGLFLPEPSFLSQFTALGILIEILEFRRPRYLLVMTLAFLLAYSGTGLLILLVFLPLGIGRGKEAAGAAVLVVIAIMALVGTGVIDLSNFTSRAGEFQDVNQSGFNRFVSAFWLLPKSFGIDNLRALLLGRGPGTIKETYDLWFGGSAANWIILFWEYGIIGSFFFCCYFAACVKGTRCPGIVVAAVIFTFFFLQQNLEIAIPLCTLNWSGSRCIRFHGFKTLPTP